METANILLSKQTLEKGNLFLDIFLESLPKVGAKVTLAFEKLQSLGLQRLFKSLQLEMRLCSRVLVRDNHEHGCRGDAVDICHRLVEHRIQQTLSRAILDPFIPIRDGASLPETEVNPGL